MMTNAQWSVENVGEGKEVVRIVGRATLNRFFVHERSGPDGPGLSNYSCYCLVKIPVEQLLASQKSEYHYKTTQGSGWTCGSEDYKCPLFVPMPLLNALRIKPEGGEDSFILRRSLNKDGAVDYPHNQLQSDTRRWGRVHIDRPSKETIDLLRHFQESLANRSEVSMEEVMRIQASVSPMEQDPL